MSFCTDYFILERMAALVGKTILIWSADIVKQTHLSAVSHRTMHCFLEHVGSRDKVMLLRHRSYRLQNSDNGL